MANLLATTLVGLLPLSSILPGSAGLGSYEVPEPEQPTTITDEASTATQQQKEMLDALNRFREDNGVAPLKALNSLNAISQAWAEKMAADGQMRHNPVYSAKYPKGWTFAGENVAQNWEGVTADELVAQWAESDSHRKNMLNTRYTHAGFGIATAEDGKVFAVQNFAEFKAEPADEAAGATDAKDDAEDATKIDAAKDQADKTTDDTATDGTTADDAKSDDATSGTEPKTVVGEPGTGSQR